MYSKSFCFVFFWCPCMAIKVRSVHSITTVGFSPVLYSVDPMLLPSGNPFKCQEEVYIRSAYDPTQTF